MIHARLMLIYIIILISSFPFVLPFAKHKLINNKE